ncbi:MAG: hypothetical protein N2749_02895 [Clostridia bacterium]|nr:hypothetical protein [Clostridia bacterium]
MKKIVRNLCVVMAVVLSLVAVIVNSNSGAKFTEHTTTGTQTIQAGDLKDLNYTFHNPANGDLYTQEDLTALFSNLLPHNNTEKSFDIYVSSNAATTLKSNFTLLVKGTFLTNGKVINDNIKFKIADAGGTAAYNVGSYGTSTTLSAIGVDKKTYSIDGSNVDAVSLGSGSLLAAGADISKIRVTLYIDDVDNTKINFEDLTYGAGAANNLFKGQDTSFDLDFVAVAIP